MRNLKLLCATGDIVKVVGNTTASGIVLFNLRDISGGLVSYVIDPVSNNIPNRTYLSAISGLNSRSQIDEEVNNLDDISIDRYELIKSVYYQNRNSQIEEDFVQNLPTPKIYID